MTDLLSFFLFLLIILSVLLCFSITTITMCKLRVHKDPIARYKVLLGVQVQAYLLNMWRLKFKDCADRRLTVLSREAPKPLNPNP